MKNIPVWILFLFALSFTFFAIQSGDVVMYLQFAKEYLVNGSWPTTDPYLYSLDHADLHTAHEYLSYLIFYAAYWSNGWLGLIVLKMFSLGLMFAVTLYAKPKENDRSPLWMGLWFFAVVAGSFRFIERSSMFSDLFCVLLIYVFTEHSHITKKLIAFLTILFFLWIQLHPGFPLGLVMLAIWAGWHSFKTPNFERKKLFWLLLPSAVLFLNPLREDGVFYPFQFALNEAMYFKHFNFEWFPTYHPSFRFTPEVLAYWALLFSTLCLVIRERAFFTLRTILIVFVAACSLQAVRFVPWASFAFLILIKPWASIQSKKIPQKALTWILTAVMLAVGIKNLILGYKASSGPRIPSATLDKNIFPLQTVPFLMKNPIPGRLYNTHAFGTYLIWAGYPKVFHHGFVTDMSFYINDVVRVFKSQEDFLELAKKYNWTMLLIDKGGSYPYFYKILSPLTDWKIVAEDDASYLIYYLPGDKK